MPAAEPSTPRVSFPHYRPLNESIASQLDLGHGIDTGKSDPCQKDEESSGEESVPCVMTISFLERDNVDLPSSTHASRKDLKPCVAAVPSLDDCAADRIADQSSDGDDGEDCSRSHANLTNVGDLRNHAWQQADEGARTEAE